MTMNLPNKLTVLRVILVPFFVFFMLAPYFEGYGNYIAVAIFIFLAPFLVLILFQPEEVLNIQVVIPRVLSCYFQNP